jgi:hypothetical protein
MPSRPGHAPVTGIEGIHLPHRDLGWQPRPKKGRFSLDTPKSWAVSPSSHNAAVMRWWDSPR